MNKATIIELGELTVGEKATTEEMVRAGEYNCANENITTANFPITRRGSRKLYLVHYKKDIDTKEVEAAVAALPVRQAGIGDKELQREFPIICLGSSAVLPGERRVPYLGGGWDVKRKLSLLYCDDSRWSDYCRFLLVGKPAYPAGR